MKARCVIEVQRSILTLKQEVTCMCVSMVSDELLGGAVVSCCAHVPIVCVYTRVFGGCVPAGVAGIKCSQRAQELMPEGGKSGGEGAKNSSQCKKCVCVCECVCIVFVVI